MEDRRPIGNPFRHVLVKQDQIGLRGLRGLDEIKIRLDYSDQITIKQEYNH